MQNHIITITAFAFMFCVHSRADQVTVENGDRVSGNIVKSDRNSMTMKTEFFGEVTIPWDSIGEIISDQELFVTAANGPPARGCRKLRFPCGDRPTRHG